MTKCYLLGAGASRGYDDDLADPPPVTDDVFPTAKQMGLFDNPDFSAFLDCLKEYNNINSSKSISASDLSCDSESFLKDIVEKSYNLDSDRKYMRALGTSYYLFYDVFRRFVKKYDENKSNNYTKLVGNILNTNQDDFVISLNYDTLFEKAVDAMGKEFYYLPGKNRTGIPIMKIHGSINWINSIKGQVEYGERNFEAQAEAVPTNAFGSTNESFSYLNITDLPNISYEKLIPSGRSWYEPVIVPPLDKYKNYDKLDVYRYSWLFAENKLKNIDELVIIGCSVRKADKDLNNLLERSLPSGINITIYTGSESSDVESRLQNITENATFNTQSAYFSDYIKSIPNKHNK